MKREARAAYGYGALVGLATVGLVFASGTLWGATLKCLPVAWLAFLAYRRGVNYLCAGLSLSALGDFVIELPEGFLAGLGLFLCAHLAYTVGLFRLRSNLAPLRALPFVAWGIAMNRVLASSEAPRLAIAAYSIAILVMVWRASALGGSENGVANLSTAAIFVGALLFALSDSLIAVNRFLTPLPHARFWIMSTYWAAQGLLATGWLSFVVPASFPRSTGRR